MAFGREAVRSAAKLKIALEGPPGTGKTFSALLMAKELGKKIGLLDSENGRALKSVGQPGIPPFMHEPLPDPTVQEYLEKTDAAAADGVDVLIYDSWSHSWTSALEAVDAMGGNKFSNGWKAVSPLVKKLIRKMIAYPGHCIATMRVDTDWAMEKDEKSGKVIPQKVGLKTVAGKGVDYEFDWVLRFVGAGKLVVMKTTNEALLPLNSVVDRSDLPKIARRLVDWLNEGAAESEEEKLGKRIDVADGTEIVAMVGELKVFSAANPEAGARLRPRYLARKEKLAAGGET
jgi:DNA polymerase III delta prime subunit